MLEGSQFSAPVYGLAFIALFLFVYGLVQVLVYANRTDRRRFERRLSRDLGASQQSTKEKASTLIKDLEQEKKFAIGRWLKVSRRGLGFHKMCEQADLPWPAYQVLAFMAFAVIAFGFIGIAFNMPLLSLLLGVAVVLIAPLLTIWYLKARRMKKFVIQLPEVFELLSQSLRAGHSLASGVEVVAQQIPDPAGSEFGRVYAEQGLGIPLEEALLHLSERIDMLDVRMFVTAVQIQRQSGGDLTEVMENIGSVIRDRIKLFGQVRALTAEGRLSGWILMALPAFVLFALFQIHPSHPRVLIESDLGRMMVLVAIGLQLVGMLWIKMIVSIKV